MRGPYGQLIVVSGLGNGSVTTPVEAPTDIEPNRWVPISFGRASARTPEERDAHFAHMVERTEPYFAKIIEDGDEPWWSNLQDRRARYDRRYTKPAPPQGLSLDLNEIRGGEVWTPVTPTEELDAA